MLRQSFPWHVSLSFHFDRFLSLENLETQTSDRIDHGVGSVFGSGAITVSTSGYWTQLVVNEGIARLVS